MIDKFFELEIRIWIVKKNGSFELVFVLECSISCHFVWMLVNYSLTILFELIRV